MKLRHAFALSLLAVLALMAIPAIYGAVRIRDVRHIALDLREQAAQAAFAVGGLQTGLARLDRQQRAYVAVADPALALGADEEIRALGRQLERLRRAGYEEDVLRSEFPISRLQGAAARTRALVEAARMDDATAHLGEVMGPLLTEAARAAERLAVAIDQSTAEKVLRAQALTAGAVRASTIGLLLALALAIATAFTSVRLLSRPLERLATSMSRVAAGDFEPPPDLPYDRRDEVGTLFRSFRAMSLRLADLDRLKAEFVGVASHDLKTPVNVITGYAELMQEELGGRLHGRHRKILESLFEQTRTMERRVEQLLEISRLQSSGIRLGLEEINVRHFATWVEKTHRKAAERQGVALSVSVYDDAPSFLIADPDCLRTEILDNLIGNALRFTPRGGRIRVRIAGADGRLVLEVSDTGLAIPAEDLPFVFDRYFQGRGLPGRAGAGLELPIAREGVEAHGGAIRAESPPAGGVTFHVTLPIRPTHGAEAARV